MPQHVSCGTLDSEHIQHCTTWHNIPQYMAHGTTYIRHTTIHGLTHNINALNLAQHTLYIPQYITHGTTHQT